MAIHGGAMDRKKRVIRDYIFIILGSFLISVASLSIYDRVELVIVGVTGVSIIIRHLFGVPLWLSYTAFYSGFLHQGGEVPFKDNSFYFTLLIFLICFTCLGFSSKG